jgi:hypothetical protein
MLLEFFLIIVADGLNTFKNTGEALKLLLEKTSTVLFLRKLKLPLKNLPAVPAPYHAFAALYSLVAKGTHDGRKASVV